jgi:hypothetical protein
VRLRCLVYFVGSAESGSQPLAGQTNSPKRLGSPIWFSVILSK